MAFDSEEDQEANIGSEESLSSSAEHELEGKSEDAVHTGELSQAHTIRVGSAG